MSWGKTHSPPYEGSEASRLRRRGVHINSGIPNHPFYLAALEFSGHAAEKPGLTWYVTLRDKLRARWDFQDAANLTYVTTGERFQTGSLAQQAVRDGWTGIWNRAGHPRTTTGRTYGGTYASKVWMPDGPSGGAPPLGAALRSRPGALKLVRGTL